MRTNESRLRLVWRGYTAPPSPCLIRMGSSSLECITDALATPYCHSLLRWAIDLHLIVFDWFVSCVCRRIWWISLFKSVLSNRVIASYATMKCVGRCYSWRFAKVVARLLKKNGFHTKDDLLAEQVTCTKKWPVSVRLFCYFGFSLSRWYLDCYTWWSWQVCLLPHSWLAWLTLEGRLFT